MHSNETQLVESLLSIVDGRSSGFKKRHSFSRNSARIWLRASFACEYCDQSLLEHEMAYYSFEYEHILPRNAYKENPFIDVTTTSLFQSKVYSDEELNTFALSCRKCNSIKSGYDPNSHVDAYSGSGPIDDDSRVVLVQQVRKHIQARRQEYRDAFTLFRSSILDMLKGGS